MFLDFNGHLRTKIKIIPGKANSDKIALCPGL